MKTVLSNYGYMATMLLKVNYHREVMLKYLDFLNVPDLQPSLVR